MKINLNGNFYELEGNSGVKRETLQEWPNNIRLDGQQQRKDRQYISTWSIDSWASGLGRAKSNVASAADLASLYDVNNCDTRIDGQICLSPAFNTCTLNPSRGDLDLAFEHLGGLYFVETTRGATANEPMAYKYTAPFTLGSFNNLFETTENIGSVIGVKSFHDKIAVFARINSSGAGVGTGNGFFWITAIGSAGPAITPNGSMIRHNGPVIGRFIPILDFGGALRALECFSNDQSVHFMTAAKSSDMISVVASEAAVVGTYLPQLVSDGIDVYAQLPQGIYNFDATPAVEVDTSRTQDINGVLTMYRNKLYFKNFKSVIKYDGTNLEDVGYDTRDGLTPEKFGVITAMCSSWKWIFAAVKGATYSHILTRDLQGWQYYARIPTAGVWVRDLFLSSAPDGIDKLWCLFGSYAYPGYFLNPLTNPLLAATYAFVPTGNFTTPFYDAGMADIPAGFFQITTIGTAIGSTVLFKFDNTLNVSYAGDAGLSIDTLPTVISNVQTLKFGSPGGLSANKIQVTIGLSSATQSSTPVFHKAIVEYLKDPDKREIFDFTIDINKTINSSQRSAEAIIGSLNYEASLRTLMPFWYGAIGTKHVKIFNNPFSESVDNQDIYEQERRGLVQIRLIEMCH